MAKKCNDKVSKYLKVLLAIKFWVPPSIKINGYIFVMQANNSAISPKTSQSLIKGGA